MLRFLQALFEIHRPDRWIFGHHHRKIPYHMILSNDDRLEIKYNRHGNIEVTLDSGDIYGRTLGNCFIPFVGLEYPPWLTQRIWQYKNTKDFIRPLNSKTN